MNKKPLIGVSILAVVLLVLGSLSNVVGYQSVKSTVNDSPLFQTRTQKATNQQQNIIISQFIGKGNANHLCIPIRDNRTELLRRAIEYISKMDDKTFERFTEVYIQRAKQSNALSDAKPNEISQLLQLMRTKPEKIINSFTNRNNPDNIGIGNLSFYNWFPGNILFFILLIFWIILLFLNTMQGAGNCNTLNH